MEKLDLINLDKLQVFLWKWRTFARNHQSMLPTLIFVIQSVSSSIGIVQSWETSNFGTHVAILIDYFECVLEHATASMRKKDARGSEWRRFTIALIDLLVSYAVFRESRKDLLLKEVNLEIAICASLVVLISWQFRKVPRGRVSAARNNRSAILNGSCFVSEFHRILAPRIFSNFSTGEW